MKLSVNEAKLIDLWARNCATIQQVLILKFAFGPEKFFLKRAPGPSLETCRLHEYYSSDWIKLRASHAIHVIYELGPVKRATYTDFVAEIRTTLYFLR